MNPLQHIVLVNDSSTGNGGDAVLARLAALRFRERGFRVSLVCGDAGEAPDLAAAGVAVVAAGGRRLLERPRIEAMRRGISDPAMAAFLRDAIARLDGPGTVWHLHGWSQIFSPAIFPVLAQVAPRSFVHAHDMFLACPNGVYMDYQKGKVCERRPLSLSCVTTHCDKRSYAQKLWRVARHRALFRGFDPGAGWAGIVAIHPDAVPRLARAGYPSGMFRVLRNPVAPFSQARIRAEENRAFVYVGRLEEDKGVLDLARAARRVDVPLICIGDGALRAELERAYPEVRLTGWRSKPEIGALVAEARALVMPSRHSEPFALVLAEAAGSGLPVAVAETALMAPEITRAGLGLSFDVFDNASFDAALAALRDMGAPEIRAMSERGFTGAARLATTEEEWIDGLLALYGSALAAAGR